MQENHLDFEKALMYSVLVIHKRYKIIHSIDEFNSSYITYYTHDNHKTVREWIKHARNVLYYKRKGIKIGIEENLKAYTLWEK